MTEKQRKKLPGMFKAFLLVNPQSESADQNARKVLDMIDDETKAGLYELIRMDLQARLSQQIEQLEDQIEMMGD